MAEQSFLAKLGLRLGVLGSSASLALAAPTAAGSYDPAAHTAANRTGFYFGQTASAEKIAAMVGGVAGPVFLSNGSGVQLLLDGGTQAGATSFPALSISQIWNNGGTDFVGISADFTNTNSGASSLPLSITVGGVNAFSVNKHGTGTFAADVTCARILSTQPNNLSGSFFAGGTQVSGSFPALTITQTWNAGGVTFTGFLVNMTSSASAAGSLIMDLQTGGVSQFSVSKTGVATTTGNLIVHGAMGIDSDIFAAGYIYQNTPGTGVRLTSPNGLVQKIVTIDNAGALALL